MSPKRKIKFSWNKIRPNNPSGMEWPYAGKSLCLIIEFSGGLYNYKMLTIIDSVWKY